MDKDVFGIALTDYHTGKSDAPLLLHNSYGEPEEMPVDVFFRVSDDFSELEHIALALCDGTILDIGAGAGSHALYLQEKAMDVAALEVSRSACEIMRERGVQHIIHSDIYTFHGKRFDTLLLLMNGIGLAGSLDGLPKLLDTCKGLLNKGGQLLFDSSDISYLYQDPNVPKPSAYKGDVQFQYEYRNQWGVPFGWLYIDQETLINIGQQLGWVVQILYEDEYDQYLARMELRG